MNSPEQFDPYAAANERPAAMTNRIKRIAEKLAIDIPDIAAPTEELARTNIMRKQGQEAAPEGFNDAVGEVLSGVHSRELARAEAMRFPVDERGQVEIAPERYQVAHEVTKKLNQTLSTVRSVLQNSVDPRFDGSEIPGNIVGSSDPFSFESEGAILDMLGVDRAGLYDTAPDSVNVVDGGQIVTTKVESPDGVVYSREAHIDTRGNEVAFYGKILKAAA